MGHYQVDLWGQDPEAEIKLGLEKLCKDMENRLKLIKKTLSRFEQEPIESNFLLISTKSMGVVTMDTYNCARRKQKTVALLREQKTLFLWLPVLKSDLTSGKFRSKRYRLPTLLDCQTFAPVP